MSRPLPTGGVEMAVVHPIWEKLGNYILDYAASGQGGYLQNCSISRVALLRYDAPVSNRRPPSAIASES